MKFAEVINEKLKEIALPHKKSPTAPYVTVSIGVASVNADKETSSKQLIQLADAALYRAKSEGRNRVCSSKMTLLCA